MFWNPLNCLELFFQLFTCKAKQTLFSLINLAVQFHLRMYKSVNYNWNPKYPRFCLQLALDDQLYFWQVRYCGMLTLTFTDEAESQTDYSTTFWAKWPTAPGQHDADSWCTRVAYLVLAINFPTVNVPSWTREHSLQNTWATHLFRAICQCLLSMYAGTIGGSVHENP